MLGKDGGALGINIITKMCLLMVDFNDVLLISNLFLFLLQYVAKMIPLFKVFAGGPLGSGKQW